MNLVSLASVRLILMHRGLGVSPIKGGGKSTYVCRRT